ncbi:conserved hypothetical protein [Vibrio chagasii]|nr:conserved hypothetical protein [Vibrio chagasii]CDT87151.1 hypothetical protein VCR12J2_1370015 [Vibrio coralliirubri]CAH6840608.1 conserved hypothetical protein [Vibrio chagasii]CAH6842507.1 conserved hypothetical protein [Vibrio chagasii]CAH7063119.1 conserved hypothetical protein [Vibrio chagasii]
MSNSTSNFANPEHCDYMPLEVFHSITGEELSWIKSCYDSEIFREAIQTSSNYPSS